MFSAVSNSNRVLHVGKVDVPETMVLQAVDAVIARMTPAYFELMHEANENPEIIRDYKSTLKDYYKDMSITPEIHREVKEAEKMCPDCNNMTKKVQGKTIAVFLEKNSTFNPNQTPDKAKLNIRLDIQAEDIKGEDSLDTLLSELGKKFFTLYGNKGSFDIRLEKGILPIGVTSSKWHYDGEVFKTSTTVCFSNKTNWSTRVKVSPLDSEERPAEHGCLYDALKVYHRAPITSDLEGETLNENDWRLFVRYLEFYSRDEPKPWNNIKEPAKEFEESVLPKKNFENLDIKPSPLDLKPYFETKTRLPTDFASFSYTPKPIDMNALSKLTEKFVLTSTPLTFPPLELPKFDISDFFKKQDQSER